jgi:hypothetical protein
MHVSRGSFGLARPFDRLWRVAGVAGTGPDCRSAEREFLGGTGRWTPGLERSEPAPVGAAQATVQGSPESLYRPPEDWLSTRRFDISDT